MNELRSGGVDGDDRVRSTNVINIASVRVAGIGGLGLVAMALIVAVFVPSIGGSLAIASVLGTILAAGLILWRRRTGPMPSSGRRPGANTVLSIDSPDSTSPDQRDERGLHRAAVPEPPPLATL
jgi:hypothetical protein